MANIQARRNKDGEVVSYSIRVHKGRDPVTGKQLKPYTTTWKVLEGWGEKRAEKEALKQTAIFEKQCRDGLALDNHQTFAAYAEYVLKQKERTGIRPLSGSTIGGYHTLVSTILAQAEKEMLIPYNPAAKATPPKAGEHNPNYFQPEEIARIWEALEREPIKWKTMVHLFLVTGCRRGEILGLKWGKVDWENKQIYIDCNLLYRKELGIYEDTPKTKGSVRYIRLPDQTMELLAEYRRWYKEEKFKWGDKWEDNDYLFPRENGAPMFPGYVCNWLADFSKRHGLPHINPHAFRHTQASMLFFNGIDSVSISHRLGHAHVSTTTDIYSHVIKEAEERISDCVADVILKPAKAKLKVVGDCLIAVKRKPYVAGFLFLGF